MRRSRTALHQATLLLAVVAAAACLAAAAIAPAASGASVARPAAGRDSLPASWWQKLNGDRAFYLTCQPGFITFGSITGQIPELKREGFRILDIFTPYDGEPGLLPNGQVSPTSYCGLAPLNYFTANPALGGDAAWHRLVRTAHAYGMAVFMWVNIGYTSLHSRFWKHAQLDEAAGRTTRYSGSFLWSSTSKKPIPAPATATFTWKWSKIAHKYFATEWSGQPEYDWARGYWPREAAEVLRYWIHSGVNGFFVDNVSGLLGTSDRLIRQVITGVPRSYPDEFVQPDGVDGKLASLMIGRLGFTDVYDTWGQAWVADTTDFAVKTIRTHDASGIEPHLRAVHDVATRDGGGSFSYQVTSTLTAAQRVEEAALIEASGIMLEVDPLDIPLSAATDAKIYAVLNGVDRDSGNSPDASRLDLPTSSVHAYAMLRTSRNGRNKALDIFNFDSRPLTVTADLAGAGLRVPQTPRNLVTGGRGRRITSGSYTVTLPPYGFALLGVNGAEAR